MSSSSFESQRSIRSSASIQSAASYKSGNCLELNDIKYKLLLFNLTYMHFIDVIGSLMQNNFFFNSGFE